MEDLSTDQQVTRMRQIADQLVEVVRKNGGSVQVGQAVAEVAGVLGVTEAQIQYGLVYAQSTGVLRASGNADILDAA